MFDFLFATFLYAAMICFVCCLRYQPSCAATIPTDTYHLAADEPQAADINQVFTTESEMKPEAGNAVIETELNLQLPVSQSIKDASEAEDSQLTSLSTGYGGSDFGVSAAVELVETQSNAGLTLKASLNTVPDPSKLTLRQCRAVIREINKGLPKLDRIRQKINGLDAPADWLRGQIARYLDTHPDKAMAMEEIR
jgi:hypothetical protein